MIAQLKSAIEGEPFVVYAHFGRCIAKYYPQKQVSPFREERTPSFCLNKGGTWHDYGTDEHGDAIDFVKQLYHVDFKTACAYIAPLYHIEMEENSPKTAQKQRKSKKKTTQSNSKRLLSIQFRPFSKEETHFWNSKAETEHPTGFKAVDSFTIEWYDQNGITTRQKTFSNLNFCFATEIVPKQLYKLYQPKRKVYGRSKTVFLGARLETFRRKELPKNYSYSLGLESLNPYEPVYLCGGEADFAALRAKGVNCFTVGSEVKKLNPYIEARLREKGVQLSDLIVLYDTDYTGITNSRLMEERYHCKRLTLPKLKQQHYPHEPKPMLNDVCDYIGIFGFDMDLIKALQPAYRSPDGFELPAVQLSVERFLTEKPDELIKVLETSDRIQLQAEAGMRKTGFTIAEAASYYISRGKHVILACPTVDLVKQLAADVQYKSFYDHIRPQARAVYSNQNKTFGKYENGLSDVEESKLHICTYDKTRKVVRELKEKGVDFVMITDENHVMTSAYGYRAKAILQVLKAEKAAKKVIRLSATPDYMRCAYEGFTLVRITRTQFPTVRMNIAEYAKSDREAYLFATAVRAMETDRQVVFRLNSKNHIKAVSLALVEAGYAESEQLGYYHSSKLRTNASSCKQSVTDTGRIPDQVKIMFCTEAIDCGISLNNEQLSFVSFELSPRDNCTDLARQLPYRARHHINECTEIPIEIHKCVSEQTENFDKEMTYQELSQKTASEINLLKIQKAAYISALEKKRNQFIYGNSTQRRNLLKHNPDISSDFLCIQKEGGHYEVNEAYLFHIVREKERECTNTKSFIKQLEKGMQGLVLSKVSKTVYTSKLEGWEQSIINRTYELMKEENKQVYEDTLRLLKENDEVLLNAYHQDTTDEKAKQKIEARQEVTSENAIPLSELTDIPDLTGGDQIGKVINRFLMFQGMYIPKDITLRLLEDYRDDRQISEKRKDLTNQLLLYIKKHAPELFADDARLLNQVSTLENMREHLYLLQDKASELPGEQTAKYDLKIAEKEDQLSLLCKTKASLEKELEKPGRKQPIQRKLKTKAKQIEKTKQQLEQLREKRAQTVERGVQNQDLHEAINRARGSEASRQANLRLVRSLMNCRIVRRKEFGVSKQFYVLEESRTLGDLMDEWGFTDTQQQDYYQEINNVIQTATEPNQSTTKTENQTVSTNGKTEHNNPYIYNKGTLPLFPDLFDTHY